MELNTMVLRGRAGSEVIFKQDPGSRPYARFRMAVSRSRRTDAGTWEDLESSWYTVKAWGTLAQNAALAVHKGQPIIVVGRPAAQGWKNDAGEVVTAMAIHAIAIGHDMGLGVSTYSKVDRSAEAATQAEEIACNPLTGVIEEDEETAALAEDQEDASGEDGSPPF